MVYWDADGDQQYDPGTETLLSDAVVALKRTNGERITEVATTKDGKYAFGPLDPATYVLESRAPTGYTLVAPQVVVAVGANLTTVFDFAARAAATGTPTRTPSATPTATRTHTPSLTPTPTITHPVSGTRTRTPTPTQISGYSRVTGLVWEDRDQNCVPDDGEAPLPGVRIFLMPVEGASRSGDAGADAPVTAWTDDAGHFIFINVAPGMYEVVQSDLPGFLPTTDPQNVTITAGQADVEVNFGYRRHPLVHLPLLLR